MRALAPDQAQIRIEIETYSDAVRANKIACSVAFCLLCGEPSEHFKRHEARPRKFRIIIADFLQLPCKVSEGYFRFLCPLCSEFITATNPKTNLARCFRCEKNFNPIDMTMLVKRWNFRETVEYLEGLIIPDR